MNRKTHKIRWPGPALLSGVLAVFLLTPAMAETVDEYYEYPSTGEPDAGAPYDDGAVEVVILSVKELTDLVGPIALYPDDLLAIVLPASTYPLEIIQAVRFLDDHEADKSLQPDESWDESVTALLNYPEVLRMMHDDIDWTWKLGGAVLNQQPDVIEAVEVFRDRAYAAGNLKSDEYQTVNTDEGNIEIIPTREEVIYVPYYEPRQVVVRQVEPVYYYYPRAYPVYYYPYAADYSFSSGFFWGVTTAYRIGWSSRYLHVRHHSYWGHPYYGHRYSGHYYRQPSVTVYNNWYVNNSGYRSTNRHRYGDRWRPRPNVGARPNGGARPDGHVRPGGDTLRRPGNRIRDGRNPAVINHGDVLTTQRPHQRPGTVTRPRNPNVDLSNRREDPDRRRDRNIVARGDSRDNQRVIRSSDREPTAPRQPIRFRDRPDTAPQGRDEIRFRDRPATQPEPSGETRFRDRRGTLTAANRPDGQRNTRQNNAVANTNRPQTGATVFRQTDRSRDRVTSRPVSTNVAVRKPVQRSPDRSRHDAASGVTRTPSAAPRPAPVYRQPTRQAEPQVRRETTTRTERRAVQPKPQADNRTGRDAASRQDKPAQQERKASGNKDRKAPSNRRSKQRK